MSFEYLYKRHKHLFLHRLFSDCFQEMLNFHSSLGYEIKILPILMTSKILSCIAYIFLIL